VSQRYTPSKLGEPIFDDTNTPSIMTEAGALVALEFNTLLAVAEFSDAGATAIVVPWVLIKGLDGGAEVGLWTPLLQISFTAGGSAPAIDPVTTNYFKAPISQSEIPPCHQLRLELVSVSAGTVRLWAALANRAPR